LTLSPPATAIYAVDDHSRLAYSEILGDERKEAAATFWVRANDYFRSVGITVAAVIPTFKLGGQHLSRFVGRRAGSVLSGTRPSSLLD